MTTLETSTPAQRVACARDDLRRLRRALRRRRWASSRRAPEPTRSGRAATTRRPLARRGEAALRLFDRAFDPRVAAHPSPRFHHGVLALDPAGRPVTSARWPFPRHARTSPPASVGMEGCAGARRNRPAVRGHYFDEPPSAPRGLWIALQGTTCSRWSTSPAPSPPTGGSGGSPAAFSSVSTRRQLSRRLLGGA